MSQDKPVDHVSPAPAKPKSSNSTVIILVVVVLAVFCLPALAGVVLMAAGAFAFLAVDTGSAPKSPDLAPMVAPLDPQLPPNIVPEMPSPAEPVPAKP